MAESRYWIDLRKPYFCRFDSIRRHGTSKVDNNNSKENSTNFSTHSSHNPLSIWKRLCATWRIHTRNSSYAFWICFWLLFSFRYLEVAERMVAMTISHFAREIKFAVHFLRSFNAHTRTLWFSSSTWCCGSSANDFHFTRADTYLNRPKAHTDLWLRKGREKNLETSSTTSLLSARYMFEVLWHSYASSKTMAIKRKNLAQKNIYTFSSEGAAVEVCKSHSSVRQMTERNYSANTSFISILFFFFRILQIAFDFQRMCRLQSVHGVYGCRRHWQSTFRSFVFFPIKFASFYRMPCSFCYIA